uniref:APC membrane recruitment protein 1 n=1 Tax=Takifugu rubripes TaxID=31033 RepID=A0A3B5K527_TAKRU
MEIELLCLLYRGSHDDITEELQPDSANAVGKPQKSGRFRRTALTFFGVRKSICILPSFFGGRSKNPIKWSSKKGLAKSKTHDGLSKFSSDDRSGYVSAGDFECSNQRDAKSLTFTRQKKGLRGLFSSFKYHRNHRNVGLEKTEMLAVPSSHCNKRVPVNQDSGDQYVTECLRSEPDVPEREEVLCDASPAPECIEAIGKTCLVTSESALESATPACSSDQINLIFGDVASLKSFDSLTGCGDIIADQEDDSITESTVSGERSRNGGKRASCYLTYQGGGEDMALPDDLAEECLHDFWENDASEEMCYTCNQEHTELTADLTISQNMNLLNSNSTQQPSGTDTSSADALTPQSDHQESVPNSDEGYYDSTTPGPDEGQEKNDRLNNDRLPRDSYSGDALYELFVPDESLISPRYENKAALPGSNLCPYLNEAVGASDSAFVMDMNQLHIGAELYKIHHFLERPGACGQFKELAQTVGGWQEVGANRNCSRDSNLPGADNRNNPDRDRNSLVTPEKRQKAVKADCKKRQSGASFGGTSDADFETFCEPKEQHLEENKPVALPYRSMSSLSPSPSADLDHGQTVSFSQALVDYTKHSQMLGNLQTGVDDLEANAAFTPHVQALPSIVTFDVVDLHNEGEYDEQIQMDLEEDISSPFQEFEESYLQKDAFAECDFQTLDAYEQNMIGQTWAVASLPRHLGLTRVSQAASHPLSLDRRSRSLDTESLEQKISDAYRENRAAILSCSQAETNSESDFSPFYEQNVVVSASEPVLKGPSVLDLQLAVASPQMRECRAAVHRQQPGGTPTGHEGFRCSRNVVTVRCC